MMQITKSITRRFAIGSLLAVSALIVCAVTLYFFACYTNDVLNTLDLSRKLIILSRSLAIILFAACNITEKIRIECDNGK